MERSRKQEKRLAEETGGKRQPGSGNKWFAKGDIESPQTKELIAGGFLIEGKTTAKKQIIVRRSMLEEHFTKALDNNRIGIFQICLDDSVRSPLCIAIVPWDLMSDLMRDFFAASSVKEVL